MNSKDLARIRARWTTERKISGADVERLLDEVARHIRKAEADETRAAADRLRQVADPLGGLLDTMFPNRGSR